VLFLAFLGSALWDKGFLSFAIVKFHHYTTSRVSKIMPCKMREILISNPKTICAKASRC
jgi:hypothetical protein